MIENDVAKNHPDFNRRDFIKGASFSSLMLLMGGVPLQAENATNAVPADTGYSTQGAPLSCGLIGCGAWGREILQTLATLPNAPIVAICDNYAPFLRRAKEFAPKAESYEDYHKLLAQKDVEAVIVATPSHLHREIVEAALKAGKHVYCEAPLAHTVEDARAIAQAATAAKKVYFQSGLQMRADPAKHYVLVNFIRAGATGSPLMARAQSHSKQSWRRTSPNPDREKMVNWRLDATTSTGLVGELGIHQLDLVNWFWDQRPTAVSGFGAILNWKDGRDVADTVQAVLQYPGKNNFSYDCSLATSFEGEYNMLYGSYATVMMRESKAWLFQEVDSPLMGWEIYATKQKFGSDLGISLAADASHSVKSAKAVEESSFQSTALHYALAAFVKNSHLIGTEMNNFSQAYGDDPNDLAEHLAGYLKFLAPAASYQAGFEATITAIKANEAIVKGEKIALPKELFDI